jgi:tRNA dimethylallyltransferase
MKLIAVIGATGTGKSQLSIELCRAFNGEVINADLVQMYKRLPTFSNKLSVQERQGIKHHLFDCMDSPILPLNAEGSKDVAEYTMKNFVQDATNTIKDIHGRGKIPVIVGGTHYYIQSLLFNDHHVPEPTERTEAELKKNTELLDQAQNVLRNQNTEEYHKILQIIDPKIALKYHPNDTRRTRRLLEIYVEQKGMKTPSELYQQQKQTPRFSSSLIFWLHTERDSLIKRLDDRCEAMLDNGLKELQEFVDSLSIDLRQVDLTKGIFQAIGVQEFTEYLYAQDDKSQTEKLYNGALERMKISTRQYAKRQVKWITNRLGPLCFGHGNNNNNNNYLKMYCLDSSNVSEYSDKVIKNAMTLTQKFLKQQHQQPPESLLDDDDDDDDYNLYCPDAPIVKTEKQDFINLIHCKECNADFYGGKESHQQSKQHKQNKIKSHFL